MEFPPDMKHLAWRVVGDSGTKMSTRIQCAFLWCYLRACEIIDWWFPVRERPMTMKEARRIWTGYEMTEKELKEWVDLTNLRKRTCKNDDPKFHKGETIVI